MINITVKNHVNGLPHLYYAHLKLKMAEMNTSEFNRLPNKLVNYKLIDITSLSVTNYIPQPCPQVLC